MCRGVVKRIAPEADVIDITHGIAPRDVRAGALLLASALPYMPAGVHVAVVDPGVGGGRRAIAVRGAEDGRTYVGPDNGLLLVAAERLGGVGQAVELTNPDYMLVPVSATFHGRDVFAPVAGHLARGVSLSALGPEVEPRELVRLELPPAGVRPGALHATVLVVDRFGNVALNAGSGELAEAGIRGDAVALEAPAGTFVAALGRTFADVPSGELILFEDSSGRLAIAANGGDAASAIGASGGEALVVRPARASRADG